MSEPRDPSLTHSEQYGSMGRALQPRQKGYPMLFSAPMVRALLDSSKTQTRRVLKPQPDDHDSILYNDIETASLGGVKGFTFSRRNAPIQIIEPKVKAGDRIWVREAWRTWESVNHLAPRDLTKVETILYEASGTTDNGMTMSLPGRLRAAMHMPRWASRLTLTVTDVRVQRLEEIGEEDAKAEGISLYEDRYLAVPPPKDMIGFAGAHGTGWSWDEPTTIDEISDTPKMAFQKLWNTINGPDAWDANPWVFAYTFDVEQRNIDQ